jgi:Tfp pilus assembly protein PilF
LFVSQTALAGAIMGDVKDTKEGMKLAIKCTYDEALQKFDKAIAEGGFAAQLAALEKVVVLIDAGRDREAKEVMAERNARIDASENEISEAEASVEETLENLRDEREKQTGRRTCP